MGGLATNRRGFLQNGLSLFIAGALPSTLFAVSAESRRVIHRCVGEIPQKMTWAEFEGESSKWVRLDALRHLLSELERRGHLLSNRFELGEKEFTWELQFASLESFFVYKARSAKMGLFNDSIRSQNGIKRTLSVYLGSERLPQYCQSYG